MTKQQTNILKGIAILMMMFLHLFSKVGIGYEGLCRGYINALHDTLSRFE